MAPTPPNEAPMAKASSFMLRVLMPGMAFGGDFVLADGHPGTADARILQADHQITMEISTSARNR